MVYLPSRMKDFPRSSQDRIVRQIFRPVERLRALQHPAGVAGSCGPRWSRPLVIDEIGVTADRESAWQAADHR